MRTGKEVGDASCTGTTVCQIRHWWRLSFCVDGGGSSRTMTIQAPACWAGCSDGGGSSSGECDGRRPGMQQSPSLPYGGSACGNSLPPGGSSHRDGGSAAYLRRAAPDAADCPAAPGPRSG